MHIIAVSYAVCLPDASLMDWLDRVEILKIEHSRGAIEFGIPQVLCSHVRPCTGSVKYYIKRVRAQKIYCFAM